MEIFTLILTLLIVAVVALFLVTGLTGAPYVPTLKNTLDPVLDELYPLSKKDLLLDLGAGDGVILNLAEKRGAKALGVELNPILALIIKFRFRNNRRISIKCRNFYNIKFPPETTVVYAFAVGPHIDRIYHKIQNEATRLGKPLYFISNAFEIKDLKPLKKASSFFFYQINP